MAFSHTQSRADRWSSPRPYVDPGMRMMTYGKVRPMDEEDTGPSFWRRLFRLV